MTLELSLCYTVFFIKNLITVHSKQDKLIYEFQPCLWLGWERAWNQPGFEKVDLIYVLAKQHNLSACAVYMQHANSTATV